MKFKCPCCGEVLVITLRATLYKKARVRQDNMRQKKEDRLRLLADNHRRRWDESEVQYLRENAELKTIAEIASFVGRTYRAVQGKAHRLGISLFTLEKQVHV